MKSKGKAYYVVEIKDSNVRISQMRNDIAGCMTTDMNQIFISGRRCVPRDLRVGDKLYQDNENREVFELDSLLADILDFNRDIAEVRMHSSERRLRLELDNDRRERLTIITSARVVFDENGDARMLVYPDGKTFYCRAQTAKKKVWRIAEHSARKDEEIDTFEAKQPKYKPAPKESLYSQFKEEYKDSERKQIQERGRFGKNEVQPENSESFIEVRGKSHTRKDSSRDIKSSFEDNSLIPRHPCDGCKESMLLNKLKPYCCNAQHILCEKCSIISNRRQLCVICDLIRAKNPSNFPEQPLPTYANRNTRDYTNIQTRSCSQCNREMLSTLLQNLKCGHSYCRECLSNHINQLILNTPISTHIEAGVVNLTCPEPTCRKLISGKIFFHLIATDTKNVYDSIISLLPKDPCNKCQKPTIRSYLTNFGCHKFCRSCIVEYFDSKLNQRQINFGCALGCYHKFSKQDLSKIMKPYQFSKFQEIESGGESKPEVIKCPGCPKEYYSISHKYSFFCKKCNTTFCGSCGNINSIQGIHYSSCRFYKPY